MSLTHFQSGYLRTSHGAWLCTSSALTPGVVNLCHVSADDLAMIEAALRLASLAHSTRCPNNVGLVEDLTALRDRVRSVRLAHGLQVDG